MSLNRDSPAVRSRQVEGYDEHPEQRQSRRHGPLEELLTTLDKSVDDGLAELIDGHTDTFLFTSTL